MNIRQLEAFRAIMIARSTIGAAQLLGMSQPAVSRLLSQLEASLKLTLFDRTSGRLLPTPEAVLLYAEVERTFISVDKIRELARDIRSANAGHLTIASLPLLALGFLPDVMKKFNIDHPRARISVNVEMSPKVEEWASAQQIDFGFAEYPFEAASFARPGIEVEEFCCTPMLLAVQRDHRLAGRKIVGPQDLAGERFISLTRNTVGRLQVDKMFEHASVERELIMDAQAVAIVAKLIADGIGIGFVDPFTLADFESQNIVPIRFEPVMELRLGLLHPSHRPMSRIANKFVALLRTERRKLLNRAYGTPTL